MQDIIINVLTTLVIVFVLAAIRKKVIKSENELNAKKEKHESLEDNYYTIQYGRSLKAIMIIGFLFFLAAFLINILTYLNICILGSEIDLFTTISMGIALMFFIFSCGGIVIWRITVDGDEIFYRNYFGITKRYTFDDISEIKETKSRKLIVYSNGKRIFSIDNNLPTRAYFKCTASTKGVPIIYYEQQKKKI